MNLTFTLFAHVPRFLLLSKNGFGTFYFQVNRKQACVHLHFVALANKLHENNASQNQICSTSEPKSPEPKPMNKSCTSTMDIQVNKSIPYRIPLEIINKCKNLNLNGPPKELPTFEPDTTICERCNWPLGEAKFLQGCHSANDNGVLLKYTHPFIPINIKERRCTNSACGAKTSYFPTNKVSYCRIAL